MKTTVIRLKNRSWIDEVREPSKTLSIKKVRKGIPNKFFSVKEVAERLGVSGEFIYKQIACGNLQCQHLGGIKRISYEALEDYLNEENEKRRA